MNDEELRAFLEGATASGDPKNSAGPGNGGDSDDGANDQSGSEAATPEPVRRPTFEELMRGGGGGQPEPEQQPASPEPAPAAQADSAAANPAAADAEKSAAPIGQPQQPSDQPVADTETELTPIILPGPPASKPRSPRPAAAARPAEPAAPRVPPTAATPAASAANAVSPAAPRASAVTPEPAAKTEPLATSAAPTSPVSRDGEPGVVPTEPLLLSLGFGVDEGEGAAASSGGTPPTDYEKISVTGGERPARRRMAPWLVVGAGAIAAVIAAVAIVSAVRGGDTPPTADPTTSPTETTEPSSPAPSTPTPTTPNTPEPDLDTPPPVQIGETWPMNVDQWGIQVDTSSRLGVPQYWLQGDNLHLSSPLISELPAACSPAEGELSPWGITRNGDGTFSAFRPETRCAEAPELDRQIWGLMGAIADSARPA